MTTNQQRTDAASLALAAYMQAKGLDEDASLQSLSETLTDLITDLRHYAAAEEIDFGAAVRISEYHYDEESQ
jgi:hypothetical protein